MTVSNQRSNRKNKSPFLTTIHHHEPILTSQHPFFFNDTVHYDHFWPIKKNHHDWPPVHHYQPILTTINHYEPPWIDMNCSISLAVPTDPGHDPSSKLRFLGRRIEAGRFILGAAKNGWPSGRSRETPDDQRNKSMTLHFWLVVSTP